MKRFLLYMLVTVVVGTPLGLVLEFYVYPWGGWGLITGGVVMAIMIARFGLIGGEHGDC